MIFHRRIDVVHLVGDLKWGVLPANGRFDQSEDITLQSIYIIVLDEDMYI